MEDRDLLTLGLVQMHKSDTVYEDKHYHRHVKSAKKLEFILNSAALPRHARLIKVVGGQY